jgi:RNA polymerase sigma-70 factor, ECF subfamily
VNPFSSTWHRSRTAVDCSPAATDLRTAAARQTAELFEEFHAPVLRYLTSLTRHPAEAEDLTQETFLRLFRELQDERPVRDPRAWLFRVAHHIAMDYHRSRLDAEPENCLHGVSDGRPDAEAELVAGEREQWLGNALASLSPQQRHCLELRSEGLRYREIAGILGVQISTVRTFVVRAVTRLAGVPR